MAIDTCKVVASQPSCGQTAVPFQTFCSGTGSTKYCDVLDKDWVVVDPARGKLYVTATEFNRSTFASTIILMTCGLSNPAAPNCTNATDALFNATCENTGADPAVDPATGNVYVAFEYNFYTNVTNPSCKSTSPNITIVPFTPALQQMQGVFFNIDSEDDFLFPGYSGKTTSRR